MCSLRFENNFSFYILCSLRFENNLLNVGRVRFALKTVFLLSNVFASLWKYFLLYRMCSLRFENNLLTFEGVRFASISKKKLILKLSFAFVSLALPLLLVSTLYRLLHRLGYFYTNFGEEVIKFVCDSFRSFISSLFIFMLPILFDFFIWFVASLSISQVFLGLFLLALDILYCSNGGNFATGLS